MKPSEQLRDVRRDLLHGEASTDLLARTDTLLSAAERCEKYEAAVEQTIADLRAKLAEAQRPPMEPQPEAHVREIVRAAIHAQKQGLYHSETPMPDVYWGESEGLKKYRELMAEQHPEEHKSHLPTERALALAQQMEQERDEALKDVRDFNDECVNLQTRIAELKTMVRGRDDQVKDIAEERDLFWDERDRARKERDEARTKVAEAEKLRGVQFKEGDRVLVGCGNIAVVQSEVEPMLWVVIDDTDESQCVPADEVEPIPAEPVMPTCKCGACVRASARNDVPADREWTFSRNGQYVCLLFDKDFCPESDCGEKLGAPDTATDSQ